MVSLLTKPRDQRLELPAVRFNQDGSDDVKFAPCLSRRVGMFWRVPYKDSSDGTLDCFPTWKRALYFPFRVILNTTPWKAISFWNYELSGYVGNIGRSAVFAESKKLPRPSPASTITTCTDSSSGFPATNLVLASA